MENTISNEIKKEMLSKAKSLLPKKAKITCRKLESIIYHELSEYHELNYIEVEVK